MNWVQTTILTALKIGLPVAVLTYALSWWALRQGFLESRDGVKAMDNEIKALRKKKSKDRPRLNPVHEKWFKFGGGFYGLVALYTYALIEAREVWEFILGLPDLVLRFEIDVLVQFLINSITHFITAITWPVYWMDDSSAASFGILFAVAYAGYWGGITLAQKRMA